MNDQQAHWTEKLQDELRDIRDSLDGVLAKEGWRLENQSGTINRDRLEVTITRGEIEVQLIFTLMVTDALVTLEVRDDLLVSVASSKKVLSKLLGAGWAMLPSPYLSSGIVTGLRYPSVAFPDYESAIEAVLAEFNRIASILNRMVNLRSQEDELIAQL